MTITACRNPACVYGSRAWNWHASLDTTITRRLVPTCSYLCQTLVMERREMTVKPSPTELVAHEAASQAGGAFIMGKLGVKTDMAKWTPAQWTSFIQVVCVAYAETMVKKTSPSWPIIDDEIPF